MQDAALFAGLEGPDALTVEHGPGDGDLASIAPTVDLDGDDILDTCVFADADGTTIATDLDGDGHVDHLTRVEADGDYAAWEPRRGEDGVVRWERIDGGRL